MNDRPDINDLVAVGAVPAELAALILVLLEHGLPLQVAGSDRDRITSFRRAFTLPVLAGQPSRDAVAGGVVIGRSLQDVLRVLGAEPEHGGELPDEVRDLGVVLVVGSDHLDVAHYMRPVERDGAGHLQRRPPAVLGAWNETAGGFDDFWWALTDELATRAGMDRSSFEDAVKARRRLLVGGESMPGASDARH